MKFDAAKWFSMIISVIALTVSPSQFYITVVSETHSFSAVLYGSGVFPVNTGNRTEIMVSAEHTYTDSKNPGSIQSGGPASAVVIKPGDAQYIKVDNLKDEHSLATEYPGGYKDTIDMDILDTHSNKRVNQVILYTSLLVTEGGSLDPKDNASPDSYSVGNSDYVNLYKGKPPCCGVSPGM